MTNSKKYPAIEGLFTWADNDPHLIGGRCESCGSYCFPKSSNIHKPGCKEILVKEVLLNRKGKLNSYTIQYYPPPAPFVSPDPFVPYAVGLVALPEGIEVLGIITGCKLEELRTSMDMQLIVEQMYTDESGNEVLGWKFKPV